jgi:lipopolysaccharide export system permease protein
MKIVDKYMVKGFLGPLIWCIVLFVVMAIIIDVFSFIDDIVKFRIPIFSIVAFYFYYTPTIFLQITPMAVLLSAIYVLSNLNKHNEITAMRSSGISLWRILMPLLLLCFLISAVVFIVNDKVIPVSSRVASLIRREELESQKRKARQEKVVENVALYGSRNRIIFARQYDTETKTLSDIIVHEHDMSQNLRSKLTAKSGVWKIGRASCRERVYSYV